MAVWRDPNPSPLTQDEVREMARLARMAERIWQRHERDEAAKREGTEVMAGINCASENNLAAS